MEFNKISIDWRNRRPIISFFYIQKIMSNKNLEDVLQKLLISDSKVIQEAETILKEFSKQPNCIPSFFQVLQNLNSSTGVRHMSAILMRQKISKFWKILHLNITTTIKTTIFDVLLKEPQYLFNI